MVRQERCNSGISDLLSGISPSHAPVLSAAALATLGKYGESDSARFMIGMLCNYTFPGRTRLARNNPSPPKSMFLNPPTR